MSSVVVLPSITLGGRWRTSTTKACTAGWRGVPKRELVSRLGRRAGDHRKLSDRLQPDTAHTVIGLSDTERIGNNIGAESTHAKYAIAYFEHSWIERPMGPIPGH